MKNKILIINILFVVCLFVSTNINAQKTKPIKDVIERLIGNKAKYFEIESISDEKGNDAFEIESKAGKIILRGSSQTAIGYAFN
jgi:alpha-N-acetylglucosaminidase